MVGRHRASLDPRADNVKDTAGYALRIATNLTLPYPHDLPAKGFDSGIHLLIALQIPSDLRYPIGGVGAALQARPARLPLTPVPEIPVTEHCKACTREYDIRFSG